ncbi:hypothetical protein [Paenibacillus roseipurpureus]|uniref:Uncharacterized protein n=1 Tax=Paenibacillus roseopurpureus TaxID=2918901 RepID=A0AA96LM84_9BACL|nr:hypothetical protein [Paenibacillus sp. MBLB1832]WNR42313.1 hypothetical protein MJB10_14325 [Paenibacillus sp. MBLB1832]
MGFPRTILLSMSLSAILLASCQQHRTELSNASATIMPQAPVTEAVLQSQPSTEDVQNQREMLLVMLFQGLLVLDRQPSLALTADQAHVILPVVRRSIEEGSIDESERKDIIAALTEEQRAYLEEQSKQMKQRMAERRNRPREKLSQAERERIVNAFERKRKVERQIEAGVSDQVNSEVTIPEPRGMGGSVEQQLVELLVSRGR